MVLNDVVFGNPTVEQVTYLEKKSFLDRIIPEITGIGHPQNDSLQTLSELKELCSRINILQYDIGMRKRYKAYDTDMVALFREGIINAVDPGYFDEIIDSIIEDTLPVVTKMKYMYQRPRPYQLAAYFDLPLYCYASFSADSPSYPSGHSFLGQIICAVLGNHAPEIKAFTDKLAYDFNESRLYLGVHYRSDIDMGIFLAQKVLNDTEFRKKYKVY